MNPYVVWGTWAALAFLSAGVIEYLGFRSDKSGGTLTEVIQSLSPHKVIATVVYAIIGLSGLGVLAWHLWWM